MRRREDRALVTGRGRFVDDLAVAGVLHLTLARSPHAHARIRSLDATAARRTPGVVAVFTAEDLGQIGPVPLMRLAPGTLVPEYPLLAAGVVRAQGVPVAAVVADSSYAASDGVDRLAVEYEPLGGVADPDGALAAGAPQVVPVSRDNRALTVAWRHGDPDRAFRDAAHRVTLTVQQQRLCGVPLEPRGALARWDADAGELTVWTSTQAPFRIRASLARMLGLDEARVRVIAPDVGGGFGVKGGPYREEVLVAWVARRLGRPVKWVSTRAEDLLTTNHGRGGKSTGARPVPAGILPGGARGHRVGRRVHHDPAGGRLPGCGPSGSRVPDRAPRGRGRAGAPPGPGRAPATQSHSEGALSLQDGDGAGVRLGRLRRPARSHARRRRLRGPAARPDGATRPG